jgi:hemerythrin-like domain-containing protein
MKPTPTPIKRSKELAPLSREHHDGLLFVFKIRQGLKMEVSVDRMLAFCNWSWTNHFAPHFYKEEKELVPVLGKAHQLVVQMLGEHKAIAALFAGLPNNRDRKELEHLVAMINDHIRFEERQLFPLVEQQASPEQMAVIEMALADEGAACGVWQDEFWVKR